MQIDKKYRIEKVCSNDPSRVNLQNVHVTRHHAFASDGRTLAAVPITREKDDTPGWLTVDALKLARKITPKDTDHISIVLNGQQVLSDETTMSRPETVEQFPKLYHLFRHALGNRTLRIGFNVKYLKDLADALGSEEIALEIGKPDQAIAVHPVQSSNKAVGIIMPIRLNSH